MSTKSPKIYDYKMACVAKLGNSKKINDCGCQGIKERVGHIGKAQSNFRALELFSMLL